MKGLCEEKEDGRKECGRGRERRKCEWECVFLL